MRGGMTIMSVVVAASLAGIVALAIGRLISGQAETMTAIKLREQREELLKHYKNIVVSGWDATRRGDCAGMICDRSKSVVIPLANGNALYLANNLYDYNYTGGTADRWWKVSVEKNSPLGGSVLQADSYAETTPLVAVTVKVEFIRKEHPTVRTAIAKREEIVFLHHNTRAARDSDGTVCSLGTHQTQRDSSGSALYHGVGGIVQYDFNSNYTKCSQVPLVNAESCTGSGALIGFFRKTSTPPQLITGNPICSTLHHNTTPAGFAAAAIRGNKQKRTVEAIDCRGRGYVKQIKPDEKPECVSPSGVAPQRVAAESRGEEFATKEFRILYRSSAGGNGVRAQYTLAPASNCVLSRPKAIESFSATDGTVSGFIEYRDNHAHGTHFGYRGLMGETGEHNGVTGARGRCGYKYCRRWETRTCWRDCDMARDGRNHGRCSYNCSGYRRCSPL